MSALGAYTQPMTFHRITAQRDQFVSILCLLWLGEHCLHPQPAQFQQLTSARAELAVLRATDGATSIALRRVWRLARRHLQDQVNSHPERFSAAVWLPVTCPYTISDILGPEAQSESLALRGFAATLCVGA